MKYKPSSTIFCPNCGEQWDESAEMYVIPGNEGHESAAIEECYNCGKSFNVSKHGEYVYVDEVDE